MQSPEHKETAEMIDSLKTDVETENDEVKQTKAVASTLKYF